MAKQKAKIGEIEAPEASGPSVNLHFGVTLPGTREYSSIRADVDLRNLPTNDDFEQTLADQLAAIEAASPRLEESLAQRAADLLGLEVGGAGLATQFAEYKRRMIVWQQKVVEEVRRLKAIIDQNVQTGALGASADQVSEDPILEAGEAP